MLATGKRKAVEIRSQNLDTVEVHVQDVDAALFVLDNERVDCEDQACVEDLVPAADVLHQRHA